MVSEKRSRILQKPVQHLDLGGVQNLLDLVESFRSTSFQSRNIFKCYQVFLKMLRDPQCVIFMGLSGAMIPGGMRKVVRDMIEMRLIDVLVSTGANIFHDIFEGLGHRHYIGCENDNDDLLRKERIVRVYDALMDDYEINRAIYFLSRVPEELRGRVVSSREYLRNLGNRLKDEGSILKTASRHGTPVFVPALADSSIGIGLTFPYARQGKSGSDFMIDQIRDNFEIAQIRRKASVTGAIYVGGGVPKNYIQQLGPVNELLFRKETSHRYAFQITTDDPKWGGLSGCTFEEAKSWGKIGKRASYAAVYVDATIALPLLVGAVLQERRACLRRKRRVFNWGEEGLRSIHFA